MKVKIGDNYSEIENILFVVPWESEIRLLLFLIFINDFSNDIKSDIKLFADDLKLLDTVPHYHLLVKMKTLGVF